jgi:hypothetical protein
VLRSNPWPFGYEELFLKGPIPLRWLQTAQKLDGQCLAVGIALWYLHGLKKRKTVALGNGVFHITRQAKSRCLRKMEAAGLVKVDQKPGAYPVVTILDLPGNRKEN